MNEEQWRELERAVGPSAVTSAEGEGLDLWISPRGRISRSTYWLKFVLPILGISLVASLADAALGLAGDLAPLTMLAGLATLWPSLIGSIKRLHDLRHSGWLVAVFYGGIFTGGLLTAVAVPTLGGLGLVFAIPMFFLMLASLWFTLKMAFVRGTIGPNEYGPDPVR
ncbi:MAG TPA: DUF805 domain-containing protein [Longimicrobiales bacterium]|nr:DUF805 domain-containing protein [Longimicrobiales bacterium]